MKTRTLIITAVILAAFSGISLAETGTNPAKPLAQKTGSDAAKAGKAAPDVAAKTDAAKEVVAEAPASAKEVPEAAKQPVKEEAKSPVKAAEETAIKAPQAGKETENPAKATKNGAEKTDEKLK